MDKLGIYKEGDITFFEYIIVNSEVIDEVYRMMLKTTIYGRSYVRRVYSVAWWEDRFDNVFNLAGDQIDAELNAKFLLYYSSLNPPEISPTIRGMYYIFFNGGLKKLSLLEDVEDNDVIYDVLGLNITYNSIFEHNYVDVISFYKKYKQESHHPFNTIKLSNKKI